MPIQPRPPRGVSGSALRLAAPARSATVAAAHRAALPSPTLRILLAGVDKDERAAVETAVRQGLGSRTTAGSWSVSVVQLAGKWSVTVDGGGLRSASAVAERSSLADAVRSLVGDGPAAPAEGPAAPPAASEGTTEVRERHDCERCGRGMCVVYEARPDEPREPAPVACPHCWWVGQVPVGAWAAAGRDYRADKA